ncbi:MAG: prefoldin subunit alpha [Desulfurococcaceae archaeon]|jgi:prefoldin alpha subunit|nr:prefoldin subunit alpha [Desulfurococcaceae archaeon]
MSTEKQEKRVITFEELVGRATELKEQLDSLSTVLNMYLDQYKELQLSMETLQNLPEISTTGFTVLDRLSSVYIPVKISEDWAKNVLVNLGLGYYMKTTREKAVEILSRRIRDLERVLRDLQTRHRALLEEYLALQRLISQIIETHRARVAKRS